MEPVTFAVIGLGSRGKNSYGREILRMPDRVIVMCEGRKTGEFDISEATQEKIMNAATRDIDMQNAKAVQEGDAR